MPDNRKQSYAGTAVRHYRRRNTLNLYLTVATGVLAAIITLLSVNVFFNLSPTGLTINGCTIYTAEQIQRVGGLVPGQNLVRLNTVFIQQRLKENLVYIEDVQVVKVYPDSLRIDIIEAKPRAQIEESNGYNTVSESGRLLEVGEQERNRKLPLVVGYELVPYDPDEDKEDSSEESQDSDSSDSGSVRSVTGRMLTAGDPAVSADEQKTEILTSLFKELDELDFKKIVKIDITDRTDIKLIYDNRIQIELGSSVDLDIKLKNIKVVLDSEPPDGLPKGYEGTLRYNGIKTGVSAIPKQEEVPVYTRPDSDSSSDSAAEGDDSSAADVFAYDNSQADNYAYGDGSADNGGYYDGSAGYDNGYYGYDDGYSADYGYGYDDGYSYGNGYGYGYDYDGYSYDNGYAYNDGIGYDDGYYPDTGYYDQQAW